MSRAPPPPYFVSCLGVSCRVSSFPWMVCPCTDKCRHMRTAARRSAPDKVPDMAQDKVPDKVQGKVPGTARVLVLV